MCALFLPEILLYYCKIKKSPPALSLVTEADERSLLNYLNKKEVIYGTINTNFVTKVKSFSRKALKFLIFITNLI